MFKLARKTVMLLQDSPSENNTTQKTDAFSSSGTWSDQDEASKLSAEPSDRQPQATQKTHYVPSSDSQEAAIFPKETQDPTRRDVDRASKKSELKKGSHIDPTLKGPFGPPRYNVFLPSAWIRDVDEDEDEPG